MRNEARATHLAYGALRGVPIDVWQQWSAHAVPYQQRLALCEKVKRLVIKYGPADLPTWLTEPLRPVAQR